MLKIKYKIIGTISLFVAIVLSLGIYITRPFAPFIDLPDANLTAQESRTYSSQYLPQVAALESALPNYRHSMNVPSLSVAIGHMGNLSWAGVNGYKDLEKMVPATLETQYRIGSVSKALTATGAARLYNEGKINLDTSISQYLATLPPQGENISLRHLLSHQAGVRHYGITLAPPFYEYWSNKPYANVVDTLDIVIDDPLLFEPGSSFSYSSYGFNFISAIIEVSSGQKFLDYMKSSVFEPLNMKSTTVEARTEARERLALWYEIFHPDTQARETRAVDNSNKWAGGGFISTPEDLVKLGNAWLENTLVSLETAQTFFEAQTLGNGEMNPQHYALGWRSESKTLKINGKKLEIKIIHHGGTAQGSSAFLVLLPEYEMVVAAAVNSNLAEFRALFNACMEIVELFLSDVDEVNFKKS